MVIPFQVKQLLMFTDIDNLLSQFQSTFQTFGTTQSVFEAISSFIETCTNTIDTLYRTQYTGQVKLQ